MLSERRSFFLLSCLSVLVHISSCDAADVSPGQTTTDSTNTVLRNTRTLHDVALGRAEAAVMGESALVDKETGRIYWEGGSASTLSASMHPFFTKTGVTVRHVRATVLTALLFCAGLSAFADWLRRCLSNHPAQFQDRSLVQKIVLVIAHLTIYRLPKFDQWFIVTVAVLYLLESWTCSTRRYLDNAISSPGEVEEYLERLRKTLPVVRWNVRCFHFHQRPWLAWLLLLNRTWTSVRTKEDEGNADIQADTSLSSASIFTSKVISYNATTCYSYGSCDDKTVVGIWKRADCARSVIAPFTKIALTKLLVLSDQKTRDDYFAQQGDFVTKEGQKDEFAEFSTNIQVEGFTPRVLAVRDVIGVPSAKLFRIHVFWISTLLGLTVPYRIWFSRHCDEVRVTVVKEVKADAPETPKSSFFWSSKKRDNLSSLANEVSSGFRKRMQQFSLYSSDDANMRNATNPAGNDTQDQESIVASTTAILAAEQTHDAPDATSQEDNPGLE